MTTQATPFPLVHWDVPQAVTEWLHARGCTALTSDSRQVNLHTGFIAWPGAATDARRFVEAALAQGAPACLVETDGVVVGPHSAKIATYSGLKSASGSISAAFYGVPSQQLKVLAITGTNGKSSSAWWLAQALNRLAGFAAANFCNTNAAQRPPATCCALVGTLGIGVPPALVPNGLTTPDPVLLQAEFSRMVATGLSHCAIEASSIGLADQRLAGTRIHTALFTNFTQDHLDYHGSMGAYWLAKQALFAAPDLQNAVVNVDDPQSAVLLEHLHTHHKQVKCWTFSIEDGASHAFRAAHLQAKTIEQTPSGLQFDVQEGAKTVNLQTRFVGRYNVSNLLGVIAVLRALGHDLNEAVQACEHLSDVPGRMESVSLVGNDSASASATATAVSMDPTLPWVVVDYAHTPDALEKALLALRPLAAQRGGELHVVFGCGGDRDATKRPDMGAIAKKLAQQIWLTSDNPRQESSQRIVADILQGMSISGDSKHQHRIEHDRAQAIAQAIAAAAPQDVVLIAGKGHEEYQDAEGVRLPFSDQAQARLALQQRLLHLNQGAAA
jgi:UDP-N-acetylmuramyl-tripeptide synthetase